MTEQQKLEEIISLVTFLQNYIHNNVKQSFTNLTFNLENLIRDYLNVFVKGDNQFENINSIMHNYPAIDLLTKDRQTAIQVTTNADLGKVKKTIKTYIKHNLNYTNLIVIGFVKATKSKMPNVKVHGVEYLIELAKFGSSEQKDLVYEILHRQIPLNSLHPLDDKLCVDIVFDVINRSAVRDYTICEGDFNRMVDGLSEVKEIITTGKIKGKSIRTKALVEYNEHTKRQLSDIEFNVSEIIQICTLNKNKRRADFLMLSSGETDRIDDLKSEIMNKTNRLAKELNLNKIIVGSNRG